MKESYRRYYEKNRDAILQRMRDRYVTEKAKRDGEIANEPELVEVEREKMRAKYQKRVSNKTRRLIEGWLADSRTSDTFKAFLQTCLKDDKYKSFTPKTLEQLYAVGSPVSALISV
jgi:hypothetical protein